MKVNKWCMFIIFIIILCLTLTACQDKTDKTTTQKEPDDNFNKTMMPIVDESITIEFMTGKSPITASDYNEVLVWEEYEKMTNIHIDWGLVPNEGLAEKRNISLGSGDYPEAFYSANFQNSDILKYGSQGVFMEMNDLIDNYMPNLKKIFEEYPEIKKAITFPDGSIYSLPTIYS